jgi:membrane protein implicated in regulation of membrane protease activity
VTYTYLVSLIAGLLLAVRLMFFGAERLRPVPGALPLRRSEPAIVAFLVVFGLTGYLLSRYARLDGVSVVSLAAAFGVVCAAVATRLAIATARIVPEHDPDDPRYALQGHVGVVTVDIPANGEGSIRYEDKGSVHAVRARDIGNGALHAGQEVCIERIDDGVAYVELWALVEQRL